MIFIDSIGHMVSDTSLEELHRFARKLGLKRAWFQDKTSSGFYHPHYDLTTDNMKMKAAIEGAVVVPTRKIVSILDNAPYQTR